MPPEYTGDSMLPETSVQSEDLELDLRRYELRRGTTILKLEKIPMELLILLVERKGQLVGRDEIVARLWGKDVFLDTEQGINTAIRKIRLAFGEDSEQPQFLQTVVGKGYRFVGSIKVIVNDESPDSTKDKTTGKRPAFWRRSKIVAALLLAVTAITVTYFALKDRWVRHPLVRSIAVLPLKNLSGSPADDYFADGMTDELITNLAKISALRVTSYTSIANYKASNKPLPQIAEELHVDAVVEGSVVRSGNEIRITAQLIYAMRDQHLWAEEYQRYVRDVLFLQREVARDIAQQVRVTLTPNEQSRLASGDVVEPAAYEAYLRGRSYWNQRNEASLHKAIEQFQKAVEIDPGYAAAYSGIADSYTTLGYLSYLDPLDAFPRAREAAAKAIDLDPSLAEAHASLAYYNFYHAWNWMEAENEFKKAIELNPNYATAHDWYSYFLMAMGRYDESWKEVNRAHELDPLSVNINTDIGFSYFYRRAYDDAIKQLRLVLATSPKFPLAHLWLGRAYQQKRMYGEAIDEFNKIDEALPGWVVTIAGTGNAYGEWEQKAEAKRVLARLDKMSREKYVTPYGVALVYAGLGDRREAISWLDKAYEGHNHWLVWLNRDPRWDRLRSDPQFVELTKKLALPK